MSCGNSTAGRTGSNQGKEEALEKACWLVKSFLEAPKQMYVELLVLVDVFPDSVKHDHLDEALYNQGLRRDEDSCRGVAVFRVSAQVPVSNR